MAVLVQYRCRGCGADADHWVASPAPADVGCPLCSGSARRIFGGALLRGSGQGSAPAAEASGCAADLPASCTLTPTAARMLSAHIRGDNRAIDRESERQTKAIAAGTLDPTGPVQALFAGGPAAASTPVTTSPPATRPAPAAT